MNDDFVSRLLLAIHGIDHPELLEVISHMVTDELRARCAAPPPSDREALVEQLAFFRRINGAGLNHETHLAEIERIKNTLGLAASELPQNAHEVGREGGVRTFGEVRVHDLWQNGVKRALRVEFPAGAQWPGLDHHVPGPEEVYVVSGDFEDGGTTYGPGTFLHYPAGSSHQPRSSAGCTLFVFYPEG